MRPPEAIVVHPITSTGGLRTRKREVETNCQFCHHREPSSSPLRPPQYCWLLPCHHRLLDDAGAAPTQRLRRCLERAHRCCEKRRTERVSECQLALAALCLTCSPRTPLLLPAQQRRPPAPHLWESIQRLSAAGSRRAVPRGTLNVEQPGRDHIGAPESFDSLARLRAASGPLRQWNTVSATQPSSDGFRDRWFHGLRRLEDAPGCRHTIVLISRTRTARARASPPRFLLSGRQEHRRPHLGARIHLWVRPSPSCHRRVAVARRHGLTLASLQMTTEHSIQLAAAQHLEGPTREHEPASFGAPRSEVAHPMRARAPSLASLAPAASSVRRIVRRRGARGD